jgi:hypothetical protein
MDINILELSVELGVAFSEQLNGLHIVAIDYLLLISIKGDFSKELLPLN